MNLSICHICGTSTAHYRRDITLLRSKHSKTLICDVLKNLLGTDLCANDTFFLSNMNSIACGDCLAKIDEYDLALMTVKRVENELREIFIRKSFARKKSCDAQEIQKCDLTIDDSNSECNRNENEESIQINDDGEDRDTDSEKSITVVVPISDDEQEESDDKNDSDYVPDHSEDDQNENDSCYVLPTAKKQITCKKCNSLLNKYVIIWRPISFI